MCYVYIHVYTCKLPLCTRPLEEEEDYEEDFLLSRRFLGFLHPMQGDMAAWRVPVVYNKLPQLRYEAEGRCPGVLYCSGKLRTGDGCPPTR